MQAQIDEANRAQKTKETNFEEEIKTRETDPDLNISQISQGKISLKESSNLENDESAVPGLGIYITPEFKFQDKSIFINCLVDSGSQINFLLPEKLLPPGDFDYMPHLFARVNSLTGHSVEIKGDLYIPVRNKDVVTNERVTVVAESVPLNAGIVGMPYLLKSEAKIDFDMEEMTLNDEKLRPNFMNCDTFRNSVFEQINKRRDTKHMLEQHKNRQTVQRIEEWLCNSIQGNKLLEKWSNREKQFIEPDSWNLDEMFAINLELSEFQPNIAMLKAKVRDKRDKLNTPRYNKNFEIASKIRTKIMNLEFLDRILDPPANIEKNPEQNVLPKDRGDALRAHTQSKQLKETKLFSLATQKVIKVHPERCRCSFGYKIQERCSGKQFVVEPLSPIYELKESNIAGTTINMLTESNKYVSIVSGSDESGSSYRENERNPLMLNGKRGDISPINTNYEAPGGSHKERTDYQVRDRQTEASDETSANDPDRDDRSVNLCSEGGERRAVAPTEFYLHKLTKGKDVRSC